MASGRLYLYAQSREDLVQSLLTIFSGERELRQFAAKNFVPTPEILSAHTVGDGALRGYGIENPWRLMRPADDGGSFRWADQRPPGFVVQLCRNFDPESDPKLEKLTSLFPITGDLRLSVSDHSVMTQQHRAFRRGAPFFRRRVDADHLIGRMDIKQQREVVVVIIDQGLDKKYIEMLGGVYEGVLWPSSTCEPEPMIPTDQASRFLTRPQWHGHMIARSVLELAPGARIIDVPLVPERVADIAGHANLMAMGFAAIEGVMNGTILAPDWGNPTKRVKITADHWVLVNAWGVKDRLYEYPLGTYTVNLKHELNKKIACLAKRRDCDVIFAAGNNGLFSGDPGVGHYDRGPDRSIWGANSLKDVCAVGSVDANGMWIGGASEGPTATFYLQSKQREKPDIAAPSWFRETLDAHVLSTGTSASCAVVAGLVTALRRRKKFEKLNLRTRLRKTARRYGHCAWNQRFGDGIVHMGDVNNSVPDA